MEKVLPPIPAKRYFTIGEVSELCGVKPYVLRYWEQEFTQLKPMKRRGNRRYYQHHEVLLVRRIRELLYDQGFTISGARNRLADQGGVRFGRRAGDRGPWDGEPHAGAEAAGHEPAEVPAQAMADADVDAVDAPAPARAPLARRPAGGANGSSELSTAQLRAELLAIRGLLAS